MTLRDGAALTRLPAEHIIWASRTAPSPLNRSSPSTRHQRTAAEAIVQADAKWRIVRARNARNAGLGFVVIGLMLPFRSTWAWRRPMPISIPGVPFELVTVGNVVGAVSVVVGAVMALAGVVLLRRALAAAHRDPVASEIFEPTSTPWPE